MKPIYIFLLIVFSFLLKAQANPIFLNTIANNDIFPQSIAYYNGEIYIPDLDNDRIIKTSITTNAPISVVVSNVKFPTGIKIIGNELYFLQGITTTNPTNNTGKLSKINLTQSNPVVTDIITGLNIPIAIDGNATGIYITENIGNYNNNDFDDFDFLSMTISKINLTGTPSKTVIFQNREYIDDLKLNGTDLYWSEYIYDDLTQTAFSKIFKSNISVSTPLVTDYYTNPNDDAERLMINNNIMYFSGKYSSNNPNVIKSINLNQNPIIVQNVSNDLTYNGISDNLYINAMAFHNNEIYFTSSLYIDDNNQRELLHKINLAELSTQNVEAHQNIKFFPNPATSILNFSQELHDVKITDMSGKQVLFNKGKIQNILVENLPKGNYIVIGKNGKGESTSKKFIKQ